MLQRHSIPVRAGNCCAKDEGIGILSPDLSGARAEDCCAKDEGIGILSPDLSVARSFTWVCSRIRPVCPFRSVPFGP